MKLLAIDGNSIFNRAFYGVRLLSNKKGMYTNAIFGFLNIMLKLQKDFGPDLTAIAFDLKDKTFRHLKYDGYKAQRKGMPDELAMQLKPLKDILTAMGYTLLESKGYEADDILGTLAKMCERENYSCVIATGDRDALQLVSENVNVCLVKTKENLVCDIPKIKELYGVEPIKIIDIKALMGDSSDNIPGVKGIGEKTAIDLIKSFSSIDNIYENIDSLDIKPRVKNLLIEDKERAYLSYELATIFTEVPLNTSLDDLKKNETDEDKLSDLLTELELFSFFGKLGVKSKGELEVKKETKVAKSFKTFINADLSELENKLNTSQTIDFLLDDKLKFNINGELYIYDDNIDDLLKKIIFNSDKPKRTFMAKKLYKEAIKRGFSFENLSFDLELGAYLLNASSKAYDLKGLSLRYLSDNVYSVEDEYFDIAVLPDLCDEVKKRITDMDMLSLYEEIELPLCEVLADMEQVGFKVDVDKIKAYGKELTVQIESLKSQMFELVGREFNPNSTKELGVILFEELKLPVKKKTKTGYSTGAEVLEKLQGMHPIIELLLEYRKLTKLNSTYLVGMLKVVGDDSRVHSTFNQTETRTGRISSTEPNVQNIPVRTAQGSKIREFFVARDGYVLIDADYSQIELRILAHIANDKNMIDAFKNNFDIHKITASQVFKTPIDEVTPQQRSRAKAINFGIVYGIGAYSLSQDINVPVYEAKEYIEEYLKTYSGVKKYMDDIVKKAQHDEYVTTIYNRRRELADINSTNKTVQAFAKRVALNTPIQGTAADIIKIAMIKVYNRLKAENFDAKLILQVHDELIIEANAMQAPMVAQILKEEMQNAAKLSVDLPVDIHTGKNWLEAKG